MKEESECEVEESDDEKGTETDKRKARKGEEEAREVGGRLRGVTWH